MTDSNTSIIKRQRNFRPPSFAENRLNLQEKHQLTPDCVRHIQIYSHPQRLPHTNRPSVASALEAKFSVQYCVARALMHGKVLLEHFEGDAWAEPQAQALLGLMDTGPHPTMGDLPWSAEVIVETADGQHLSEKNRLSHDAG